LFALGGARYSFTSSVQGRCLYALSDGEHTPALVLSYPHALESRQRRAHYRVPLGTSAQVSVAFVEYAGDEQRLRDFNIHAGIISDISAGGLAMLVRQRLPASIAAGTRLRVSFQLPGEPEHLCLTAAVRNVRDTDESNTRICGIEFVVEAQDIPARQSVDLVQRFVVKRQREILKKLRML
jgi:c-di-GMP-binding flagellar brake protein YcgR